MMNTELISELIQEKKEKQQQLKNKVKELDQIDLNLYSITFRKSMSNLSKSFGGFIYLLIGLSFFIGSITLLINPEIASTYGNVFETSEQIAKRKVFEYTDNIELSEIEINGLYTKIQQDIELKRSKNIRIASLFLFAFSLFLLYKRKHLKAIKERNSMIVDLIALTQSILSDYKTLVKEDELELGKLENVEASRTTVE